MELRPPEAGAASPEPEEAPEAALGRATARMMHTRLERRPNAQGTARGFPHRAGTPARRCITAIYVDLGKPAGRAARFGNPLVRGDRA